MTIEQMQECLAEIENFAIKSPPAQGIEAIEADAVSAIAYHALAGTILAEVEKLAAQKEASLFANYRREYASNADWNVFVRGKMAEYKYILTRSKQLISSMGKRIEMLRSLLSYEKLLQQQGDLQT